MKNIEIKGKKRETVGAQNAKKSRKLKQIPCVMYGAGRENVHFIADETEFKPLVYTPSVYTVKIDIEGQHYDAVLQAVQYHPVNDKIIHVDFLQIDENKKLSIEVPVKLHGFPIGVKEGGKLALIKRKLKLRGLIKDMPDIIDIDVDNLKIGQSIKVSDLTRDNVEFLDVKNSVVASVKVTRNVVEEATPGTETAATASAAATPAATAAPAKKDDKKK